MRGGAVQILRTARGGEGVQKIALRTNCRLILTNSSNRFGIIHINGSRYEKGITEMPLSRSKFQPKKSPVRRATSVSNLRRRSLDPSHKWNKNLLKVHVQVLLDMGILF